jgi:hypothetical protein
MQKPRRPKTLSGQLDLEHELNRLSRPGPAENQAAQAGNLHGLVPLAEDNSGHHFLVYLTDRGMQVDLRYEGDTFWASQAQMAAMFGVTPQNVTTHLKNIFRDGELTESSACKESLHTGRDGKRYPTKLYDLRGGCGCLNKISASLSGASAGFQAAMRRGCGSK